MSEAPAPSSGSSGSTGASAPATMARNIVVSVLSTVLGATAIYFLGFNHKSGGNDYLTNKEATTKAWKSYVTSDNIYYKNLLSLSKDKQIVTNLDNYKSQILKEADRFKKDVEMIEKEKDVDKSFITLVDRRLEREKESLDYVGKYFDKIKSLLGSVVSDEQKNQQWMAESANYQNFSKGLLERTATELEDLSKVLVERYGQVFNLADFLFYSDYKKGLYVQTSNTNDSTVNQRPPGPNDPNNQGTVTTTNTTGNNLNNNNTRQAIDMGMVTGEWDTPGAGIDLLKDGSLYWNQDNGETATGTWRLYNNQLYMYPRANAKIAKGTTWIFNLSNLTPNSFIMQLTSPPYNMYNMVRTEGNQ